MQNKVFVTCYHVPDKLAEWVQLSSAIAWLCTNRAVVFFLCLDLLTCYVIGVWELILNFTEKFNSFFKSANQPLDIVHEPNINTLKNCRLFQRFEFESQLWYTYFVQSSSLHTWTCASQSKSNSDGKPTTDVIACLDFNRNTGFLHAQDHLIANSNFGIR